MIGRTMMHLLFLVIINIMVRCESRPQIDYADPYNVPQAEDTLGYRYNPGAAITTQGKTGTAITSGVHDVNADLDAVLDLEDQVIHAPVHGTIIMPRLAAKTTNPWAGQSMSPPRELNPMFPMTIEDNYLPSQQFSDSLIVMVDDPVILVGQKPS